MKNLLAATSLLLLSIFALGSSSYGAEERAFILTPLQTAILNQNVDAVAQELQDPSVDYTSVVMDGREMGMLAFNVYARNDANNGSWLAINDLLQDFATNNMARDQDIFINFLRDDGVNSSLDFDVDEGAFDETADEDDDDGLEPLPEEYFNAANAAVGPSKKLAYYRGYRVTAKGVDLEGKTPADLRNDEEFKSKLKDVKKLIKGANDPESICNICMDSTSRDLILMGNCPHSTCRQCLNGMVASQKTNCAFCRTEGIHQHHFGLSKMDQSFEEGRSTIVNGDTTLLNDLSDFLDPDKAKKKKLKLLKKKKAKAKKMKAKAKKTKKRWRKNGNRR